jgi:transposase InsO family protein
MAITETLAQTIGVAAACAALNVARSTLYRKRQHPALLAKRPVPEPAARRALSAEERTTVRTTLNRPVYADSAPREVYAALLEQDIFLCSVSTMYRILRANLEVRERRNQLRHPLFAAPELLATAPNQVWTWDITRLLGPHKWTYYYLYVLLDLFSRKVVGWLLATCESAELAQQLVLESCLREGIAPEQLTLHADRGSAMTSKSLALLLTDLGVRDSHSRPHVSNDNPYSEAQFKTLKYHAGFPACFGSLADARAWCQPFFAWYNAEHHHTGLGLLTPAVVHAGQAVVVQAQRQATLSRAYRNNPARFVNGPPVPPALPTAAWINPPAPAPPATTIKEGFHTPIVV